MGMGKWKRHWQPEEKIDVRLRFKGDADEIEREADDINIRLRFRGDADEIEWGPPSRARRLSSSTVE